jgi:hypothetical protein
VRADINDLPFKRFPKIVIVELVRRAVSDTLSPFTMITGKLNPDYSKVTLDFGTYVQVFEDNNPTNSTMTRSTGAIALNPLGNVIGDFYFMSLKTGRRISRRKWKVIPITSEIITIIEQIALREKQAHVSEGCPVFEWSPNSIIDDEPDDDNHPYNIADDFSYSKTNINACITNDNIDVNNDINDSEDDEDPDYESDSDSESDNSSTDEYDNLTIDPEDQYYIEVDEQINHDVINDVIDVVEQDAEVTGEEQENVLDHGDIGNNIPVPVTNAQYNLRENRTRDYSHRFSEQQLLAFETNDALHNYVTGYVMTQMTAQAGIKKHGSIAIDALLAEFFQLDDKAVLNPMIATEFTSEQKRAALRAVNLIKEKRCGKLKRRTCADGRPQQGLYDKQQTASLTVSTDALMISLMIDSFERRDVATADIAGAY